MAVEWSRPRQTPMAGRRKATSSYCSTCQIFHRTERHPDGAEFCQALKDERIINPRVEFPFIRQVPRTASK
jgi:hypothetical protein